MDKIDLRRMHRHLYQPPAKEVTLVEVPPLRFAAVDGAIEPGRSPGDSPSFGEAVAALYGLSYTLKFASKKRAANPVDYTVMGLEALWWVEDGEFEISRPDNWRWKAMILQPDHVDEAMFRSALEELRRKKPGPGLERLRLETFHEGLCVQVMHVGPYSTEPATVERMRAFARENGWRMGGRHHEIYLGDPRRTEPSRLKTVLRHPVEKTG